MGLESRGRDDDDETVWNANYYYFYVREHFNAAIQIFLFIEN